MAGEAQMRAALVIRLRDQVTGGIQRILGEMGRLRSLAARMGGLALGATRAAGALGTVAGLSLIGPLRQAAAFDNQLRLMAVTAGRTGAEVQDFIARTRSEFQQLAEVSGQRFEELTAAGAAMFAANLPDDVVRGFLPTLARASTATGASIRSLTDTVIALNQNLGVKPEGLRDTLAALAEAGKQGRFELPAMARSFPQLTAAAEAIGLSGRDGAISLASWLQVARRGAPTEDIAANNLTNFLGKITGPETVRNFAERGVDLPAMLANARRAGFNPMNAVLTKVLELTRGDMFQVGQLFGDKEVLDFLRPALSEAGRGQYLQVRDAARAAGGGLLDTDFATMFAGPQSQLDQIAEKFEQLAERAGRSVQPMLGAVNDALGQVVAAVRSLDALMPGQIDRWAMLGAQFTAAAAAIGLVTAALTLTGAVLGPVGIAVTALGAAAVVIVTNWTQVRDFFAGLWQDIAGGFDRYVRPVLDRLERFFDAERAPLRTPEVQRDQRERFRDRGRLGGFPDPIQPQSAPGGAPEIRGAIQIGLAPGLVLRRAESETPGVSFSAGPDRGLMLRGI